MDNSFPIFNSVVPSTTTDSSHHHCHGQSRCLFCGCFFKPDPRQGDRQKACSKDVCRRRRKKQAQIEWVAKNSGYFNGRYHNVKAWRKEHPDHQKSWRIRRRLEIQDTITSDFPIITLHLATTVRRFSEIQDTIRRGSALKRGLVVYGRLTEQDTRHDGSIKRHAALRSP